MALIKKTGRFAIYILILIALFFAFAQVFNAVGCEHSLLVNMQSTNAGEKPLEVFYLTKDDKGFSQDNSFAVYSDDNSFKTSAKMPLELDGITTLRLDLGDNELSEIVIGSVTYNLYNKTMTLSPSNISSLEMNELEVKSVDDNGITLLATGNDPYIIIGDLDNSPLLKDRTKNNNIFALIVSILVVFVLYKFVHLRSILAVVRDLYNERKLIASLASNDFKTKFAGSYFGIIWAYVQPICTILVFWFVFQIGFRNPNVGEVEYILWFMTGLIPWFFFSEAWNSATNAFIEYSYLVKKVVFKINILPLIKIISALFIHLFFVVFMLVVYMLYGRFPTVYCLQLLYYMLCMVVLVVTLSFITAPLIIFFRDLGQIMNIVLQFGMWLTPIMWSMDNLPAGMGVFVNIFKLNPMYYIVQGYRNSMIYNVMFYDNILQTAYFWTLILVLAIASSFIYKKLKPHFADVL